MTRKPFVILGAGGHGRVVAAALRSAGQDVSAFLEADRSLWGKSVEGILVAGGDSKLADFPEAQFFLAVGVGASRNTARRRRVYESVLKTHGRAMEPVIAASAVVAPSARLGVGVQVLTRAVVHPGTSVGDGVVVNTAAVLEHDCTVADHTFIGPGAIVCGGVAIGVGSFIGAGAVILPGVRIGAHALVAAGVTVRADIGDGKRALDCYRRNNK